MEIPFTPDLGAFLTWLAMGGGSLALVMWFVSWGLENVTLWVKLPSRAKSLLILVVTILFSVGAYELLKLPALIAQYDALFKILLGTVIAWLASQGAYMKAGEKGLRFPEYGARPDVWKANAAKIPTGVTPPSAPSIDA